MNQRSCGEKLTYFAKGFDEINESTSNGILPKHRQLKELRAEETVASDQ